MAIGDKLGARLGPRLAQMLAATLTEHKRQGLPLEADARHLASWKTLTALGQEFGDVFNATFEPVLDIADALPPSLARIMQTAASGQRQGTSFGMGAAVGVALGPFSTLFDNLLAHPIYDAVALKPSLIPTIDGLARLFAIGNLSEADYVKFASWLGFDDSWAASLAMLQESIPTLDLLFALRNREIIDDVDVDQMMERLGYSGRRRNWLRKLRFQILSPADAALAVLRGNMDSELGATIAAESGVTADSFQVLIDNTGEPPAVEALISLYRRGKIEKDRLERGIRQSRVRNEWIPEVELLGVVPPTHVDILEAYLEGQIDRPQAFDLYQKLGGDPDYFELLYNTRGNAPTPVEAGVMANRGIIPWEGTGPGATSFEQAFLEGPWRNKWLPSFQRLSEYFPPPRTVTALYRERAISKEQAIDLLERQGLSEQLATAYTVGASNGRLATAHDLAIGQISELYEFQAIDRNKASELLAAHGYDPDEVNYLLWLADFTREKKFIEAAIGRVRNLFVGHKLAYNDAVTDLDQLSVPAGQRDHLLKLWELERRANVRLLTPAQIRQASNRGILEVAEATERLVQQGYSEADAGIYLQLSA